MAQTTNRGGNSFSFSTSHLFNFQDTLGSLVFPPASQTEGWYHFGFVGLLLIVLFLLGPVDKDKSGHSFSLWVKIAFVSWFLIISYITYSKESILFNLFWRFIPGFSNLRAWGRLVKCMMTMPSLGFILIASVEFWGF